MGRDAKQLVIVHPHCLYFLHLEYALRQRSCLVKHEGICLGKVLQIVAALDYDPLSGC